MEKSTAVYLLLLTYFISVISELKESPNFLKYFTPFKYTNPLLLLNESRFEVRYLLIAAGIIVVSYVGAFMVYSKRDLYI